MPNSVRIAVVMYVLTTVYSWWGNTLSFLMIATPLLLVEGLVVYKICVRRNWARWLLLVFAIYTNRSSFSPSYLSFTYDYFFAGTLTHTISAWQVAEPILASLAQISAVALFFLPTSNKWFRDVPTAGNGGTGDQS